MTVVHSALMWFRESLRHPDWVAAFALSIQILIFAWQAWILRRHAGTLEKHTDIADKQQQTAKLIGEALIQQGKIMAAQFSFQRQLEAQSERKIMFDLIVKLLTSVNSLTANLGVAQYTNPREIEQIQEAWIRMDNNATACRMALIVSEHLSRDEEKHFACYLADIAQLNQTNASNHADYIQLKNLNEKHKDFLALMTKNKNAAIAAITIGN